MSIRVERQHHPNGVLRTYRHYYNDYLHREDGPAEEWYLNNRLHRLDGPAHERFYPDGVLDVHGWYVNGTLHREDGPAIERFAPDGRRTDTYYYLAGNGMSEQEHRRRVLLQKLAAAHTSAKEASL